MVGIAVGANAVVTGIFGAATLVSLEYEFEEFPPLLLAADVDDCVCDWFELPPAPPAPPAPPFAVLVFVLDELPLFLTPLVDVIGPTVELPEPDTEPPVAVALPPVAVAPEVDDAPEVDEEPEVEVLDAPDLEPPPLPPLGTWQT
jgi:hypothetical protein